MQISPEPQVMVPSAALACLSEGVFRVRTLDEARDTASMLAHLCPLPEVVAFGLTELMINAVEHGNLGITFEEKSALCREDRWQSEVEERLELPGNRQKRVEIRVRRIAGSVEFVIADDGRGFDWRDRKSVV